MNPVDRADAICASSGPAGEGRYPLGRSERLMRVTIASQARVSTSG
jgi:hypothetical protein